MHIHQHLTRATATAVLSVVTAACFLTAPAARAAARDEWMPVTPAELALAAPAVEPDADAEALFWDVRVQDRDTGSRLEHIESNYLRIKVFNERGKESQSTIEIPYATGTKVENIAGRTVKKDGTIVALEANAVFDRTIVKYGDLKVNVKSFAMPAVEPGCIIEYRWQEVSATSAYQRLDLQRDIPVQRVTYHIKPFATVGFDLGMRFKVWHGSTSPMEKDAGGFVKTEALNVKAFHEEPNMPPEDQVRTWLLLFYSDDTGATADQYWNDYGKKIFERTKGLFKVTDEIRRATAEVTAGAASDADKIAKIHTFCRTRVKNVSDDASGMTEADLARMKENNNANDVLRQMKGTSDDINALFAAMCLAAGFDTRAAAMSDRGDFFFDPAFPDSYFLRAIDIAVKTGDQWHIYDPGSMYVTHGMLTWNEEGTRALVSDPKAPFWTPVQLTPASGSANRRTATLTLSEDGTLEGDIRTEMTGHLAVRMKENHDEESPAEREKAIVDEIHARVPAAEVTNLVIENVTDFDKPFVVAYHVRIPGYAQKTGKRLFLQPAFFQTGEAARFQETARRHLVYFHYPWTEEDSVTITLPAGYALDNAEQPESFRIGPVGEYTVKILVAGDGSKLEYHRTFVFGADGSLYFPAAGYDKLKMVFDAIHERDGHTLTLKQKAAGE